MRNSSRQWVCVGRKLSAASAASRRPQSFLRQRDGASTAILTAVRIVVAGALLTALSAPAFSDQAKSAYNKGARAEAKVLYDAAFQGYSEAHRLKPNDTRYLASYLRMRSTAAIEHVRKGQTLRDNFKFQEAL